MDSPANSISHLVRHPNGQTTHLIPQTILIQGGFARHSAFWYHWIPSLARHYRVIHHDTRGHGKSSAPVPSDAYAYTLDTVLEEIVDTLDQPNLEKVHFVGESTSGMLGEALAAKYPARLNSLTICSSPTHLPQTALELFSFGRSSWSEACRKLGSKGWGPGRVCIPSMLDTRPLLEQISVPMLILTPANSVVVTLEEQLEINGSADDCLNAVKEFLLELDLRFSLDTV
ncbi:Alpha/Beta hydrolase protein [Aspergillus spectabilis]